MGFLQYLLKKADNHITTEQTPEQQCPWKSLKAVYTKDGSFVELFFENNSSTKIKDFRTGQIINIIKNPHYLTHDLNRLYALSKLYGIPQDSLNFDYVEKVLDKYADCKILGEDRLVSFGEATPWIDNIRTGLQSTLRKQQELENWKKLVHDCLEF